MKMWISNGLKEPKQGSDVTLLGKVRLMKVTYRLRTLSFLGRSLRDKLIVIAKTFTLSNLFINLFIYRSTALAVLIALWTLPH